MKRVTNAKTWETALNHLKSEMGYSHLWKRLAAIEDILSDENGEYDLDRLKERYAERITLRDEVAELVKAKREGRCAVFPVKNGDKVYCLQSYFNDSKMKSEIKVKCRIVDFVPSIPNFFETNGLVYSLSDVGKTVFLTREAAEQALKEQEDGRSD